jgi:O-antigen/teichoic acid export membrane protein
MASTVERKSAISKGQPRGRHRRARPSVFSPVRKFGNESLFRNSVFLVINLALGAGCGYGALLLLTRLFSVQAVGLSAAAASASALIVFIMQFGINYSLPRFLPTSRNRTALINTVFTIIFFATLLGAVAYLMLPFAGKLYALGGWLFGVVFIMGACVQAGESALETILVADRSSSKVASGNVVPNLVKLAAPAVFVFLGTLGAYVSRVVAYAVGLIVLGVVLARRGHRFRPALSIGAIRDLGQFSAGMYIASLIGSLPLMVVPIMILSRFGSRQSAYWAIAITIASLLYQLPGTVSQALLPELASRPSDRSYLLRRSAVLIVAMVVPVLILAYIAAPLVLALFGHSYASGSLATLRWLIIAGFITILNYVTGAILFLAKKTLIITAINVVDAVIVLGMTATWAGGAQDVAISWVVGDISNTVLFGVFAFLALHQVRGRWEALGDPHAEAALSLSESREPTVMAQQRGIEALIMLAVAQRTGPWQGSYPFPMMRVHDSFVADGKE